MISWNLNGAVRRFSGIARSSATGNAAGSVVVIGGTGFIGSYVVDRLLRETPQNVDIRVTSRSRPRPNAHDVNPRIKHAQMDITNKASVQKACEGASAIINLVGIMHEQPGYTFDLVQIQGARHVAEAAKENRSRLVQISAIGADSKSSIPYARTKGVGEIVARELVPDATVIRPSIVFGPEDDFFNRFAMLGRYLPLVPVFGGGTTRFQPVYVDDLAAGIVASLGSQSDQTTGHILEAGGPTVYTYKELMRLTLKEAGLKRPVISVPWGVAKLQAFVLERLPTGPWTLTRDQVELLKKDNVVGMTENVLTLQDIGIQPKCAEDILPTYLGARSTRPLTVKPQRRSYSTSPRYPASSPQIVHTVSDYRELINAHRRKNPDLKIGFIPTMGALHAGHLSLARQARQQIPSPNLVVASIFVNPAQFAPTEDLDKYPRTLDQDVKLLAQQNTDIVFAPSVSEMYPRGITLNTKAQNGTFVEVLGLSSQMEGQIRPHFFRGVATVVAKLFNIIQPTTAYFGQKDVQQCAVVRSMVRDLHMPLEVVVSPTVRETDGLAMSSRNAYLTPEERVVAPVLYRAMCTAQQLHLQGAKSRERILKAAKDVIDAEPGAVYEYLSLADPFDLQEVNMVGSTGAILSGAVRIGKTRIIDNILLDLEPESVGGQKTKKA